MKRSGICFIIILNFKIEIIEKSNAKKNQDF